MAKTLSQLIVEEYPALQGKNIDDAGIVLQNDSDGTGDYIAAWTYFEPIPDALKSFYRS
jgi:hypothetical protein